MEECPSNPAICLVKVQQEKNQLLMRIQSIRHCLIGHEDIINNASTRYKPYLCGEYPLLQIHLHTSGQKFGQCLVSEVRSVMGRKILSSRRSPDFGIRITKPVLRIFGDKALIKNLLIELQKILAHCIPEFAQAF